MGEPEHIPDRIRVALASPVDAASLVVFRVAFGLLATVAAVRFVALGWVDELLLAPSFHFVWLDGVATPPAPVLYALFAVQALAGLGIAAGGRLARPSLAAWLLSFGYVELLDKTLYLNHYVLFTLLGLLLFALPIHRVRLRGGDEVPAWTLWLLRVQIGTVYFWAGAAKLNADWLLRAEPLATWLGARVDVPIVGPLLALPETAYAMSWGGAVYDLAIPFLLLYRRTRAVGVILVAVFHLTVGALFPIGIFPWLMIVSATLFLAPDWPRQLVRRWSLGHVERQRMWNPSALSWKGTIALGLVATTLALFPARFVLWGTDVSWSERGYRFAWRVMLNEKTGLVDYRVVERETGRIWRVMPADELTPLQHQHMRTQPDMIRDYAVHLRDAHRREGRDVAVYADAWASLNGRPTQRLLRDDLDLTQPLSQLEDAGWIVPLHDDQRLARAQ
jgi:hypothetical protein